MIIITHLELGDDVDGAADDDADLKKITHLLHREDLSAGLLQMTKHVHVPEHRWKRRSSPSRSAACGRSRCTASEPLR